VRNTFPVLLYKENSLKSPKESINKWNKSKRKQNKS
jgi:hypothetical protein